MTFATEEYIVYSAHGVCRIAEIIEKEICGKKAKYYALEPVYDKNMALYVPVDNEKLTAKMHKILSAEEIYALVRSMPENPEIWIENEQERKAKYKEILEAGERGAIVCLIKTLHNHEKKQKNSGRKLHVADERFLREAEKILHEEFAYVLDISVEQVVPFILNEIEVSKK